MYFVGASKLPPPRERGNASGGSPLELARPESRPGTFVPPELEELVGAVNRELTDSPYGEVRSVRCGVSEGVLTLSGEVPTFYLKQLAQSTARRAAGDSLIRNRIEVLERLKRRGLESY